MKRKIYTLSHNIDRLKEMDSEALFTSEEVSRLSEDEWASFYSDRDALLQTELSQKYNRLPALSFLVDHFYKNGYRRILSLGAGSCYAEHILSLCLPPDARIAACDYNRFTIERCKHLFDNVSPFCFDFAKDTASTIIESVGEPWDVGLLIGAVSMMEDDHFYRVVEQLRLLNVKEVVDLHYGFMQFTSRVNYFLEEHMPAWMHGRMRELMGKPPLPEYRGKHHGYTRDKRELRRLYRSAGLKIVSERKSTACPYLAILSL